MSTPTMRWAEQFLAHYLTKAPSLLHQKLALTADRICLQRTEGIREVYIGPRLTAKSTWLSMILPLRAAVEQRARYIWLVSDTATQARLNLDNLKHELTTNLPLLRAYPDSTGEGPTWREDRILLKNGVMIEAISTNQKMRGRRHQMFRPDLIIVDDPQNDEHTDSAPRREKSLRWFERALVNAGNKESNILVAGTTLHRECIVEAKSKAPGWTGQRFRSIVEWPKRLDLWDQWERVLCNWEDPDKDQHARDFYEKNRKAMDAGAVVLWPESEALYDLMLLRATTGHNAFEAEKQSNPINPEACEWPEVYFTDPSIWVQHMPKDLFLRAIMVDPSKGRLDKPGDFSAIVKVALGADGYLYVQGDLARRPIDVIVEDTLEDCREFEPEAVGFESNAFQEYIAEDLQRQCMKADLLLPVVKVTNTVKKTVRIRRLGPYLSQKRMRFVQDGGTIRLVNQLRDFPQADHDDGPDALEGGVRILANLASGKKGEQEDDLGDGIPLPGDLR